MLFVASWRVIFAGFLVMAIIAAVWLWRRQPETLPRERRSRLSVSALSAAALEGARPGKSIEAVARGARTAVTKSDAMDGVADLIPMVQIEAVFTDGSRLVTVHSPIQ